MTADALPIEVEQAPTSFEEWDFVLTLLQAAFAYQEHRIDPPSSVYGLSADSLARKAAGETLFVARIGRELAGCIFARDQPPVLYVGKLAVWPHLQGHGIGRRLMQAVQAFAIDSGRPALELETRIELTENHRVFESLGFSKVSEHAHQGFDRPTYIRMRKQVAS